MITLTKLANYFEDGLNKTLNNPEIQFKIWADAGKFQKPFREGNSITHYVNGNLKTSTSANDANDLVMGVNGLSLEFAIETQMPRTNGTQTAEELAKIKDGQYPFVTYIVNAINGYFQKAQSFSMPDESGVDFSVSYQAGTAVTGEVGLSSQLDNYVLVSVYIEVYFIEGGISSKDVKVYFDNSTVPFMAVRHGRTPVVDGDVYAGKLVTKNIITSTAFAIDIDFPANADEFTKACVQYLLDGEPNTAHFVKVVFGELDEKLYFMTLNTVQTSAQGISIAGGSASLMEVVENPLAGNLSAGFQLGKFKVESSQVTSITFAVSKACNAFIAGNALELAEGSQTVNVTPSDIVYEENNDCAYYVYLITDKAVTVTATSAPFETV